MWTKIGVFYAESQSVQTVWSPSFLYFLSVARPCSVASCNYTDMFKTVVAIGL